MPSVRHVVLAVRGLHDPVLHHIAPLGLAASVGTAVVLDLDPDAPAYPEGETSVFDLIDRGPRLAELDPVPGRVALFANGGARSIEAWSLVEAMAERWPAVVVRIGAAAPAGVPCVPVIPLLPGPLHFPNRGPALYQSVTAVDRLPGPGLRLPPLRRARIAALVGGRIEPRWRWVRAFQPAWSLPWP
jgi:hypothetical protein